MQKGTATVKTLACSGLHVHQVDVEVHLSTGLPSFSIVGLAEKAVRESRERVRAAISNSNWVFPRKRVLVNMSPADEPKQGSHFDLPIAVALLLASGQVTQEHDLCHTIWIGELSLGGQVREVRHILPLLIWAARQKMRLIASSSIQVPLALKKSAEYLGAADLAEAVAGGVKKKPLQPLKKLSTLAFKSDGPKFKVDLKDVEGQELAKIGLLIAAAGRHHLMLVGAPGVGKTMLAQALPSICAPLGPEEVLEVALLHSWQGEQRLEQNVPMRSPHHSITAAALFGGGVPLLPGEVSLAHKGILFLDELPDYPRSILDQLRDPLVSRAIAVSRVQQKQILPADILFMAAMNPCPCGFFQLNDRCVCGYREIQRYQKNITGPLLDRIDIWLMLTVEQTESKTVLTGCLAELASCVVSSSSALAVVKDAQQQQLQRFGERNAHLTIQRAQERVDAQGMAHIRQLLNSFGGGLRCRVKLVALANTIADCLGSEPVTPTHIDAAWRLQNIPARTKVCTRINQSR